MAHPIVHIELSAKDHKEAAAWYKDIFGWEITEFPDMNYSFFAGPNESVGGGFNPVSDETPAGEVLVYIHTDNLAATINKIKEAGGTVVVESFDIPTVGTMGVFKDPTGNLMALLQPAQS